MDKNDSSRLKRLYEIEERRFLERRRKYEETGHLMDVHQFYLEDILLKREELFYKYCPSRRRREEHNGDSSVGFDYAFLEKDAGSVGWKDIENRQNDVQDKRASRAAEPPAAPQAPKVREKQQPKGQAQKASRVYACEIEGCNKKYTSSFGLKYHIRSGHTEEKKNIHKPYLCPFKGCDKKYKNSNGLKYHISSSHDQEASL
jgi:hypothetical protein